MSYDVVAIDINRNTVRLIANGKSLANAEAIVMMAIARRGLEEELFSEVVSGTYNDGDKWEGEVKP